MFKMSGFSRLNASTEIIPIQGPSGRNDHFRFRTNFRPRPQPMHPYFVDPNIVSRVKQYLEDHKDSVYVDIHAMVEELQRKYREYGRRKRSAFKQSVEKAFGVVLQQYGIPHDYSLDDGGRHSESSEEDVYSEDVSLDGSNAAGLLTNMYMNRAGGSKRGGGGGTDKELINISSDEDDGSRDGKEGKGGRSVAAAGGSTATPSAAGGKSKASPAPALPDAEVVSADVVPAKPLKPNMATSTPLAKSGNSVNRSTATAAGSTLTSAGGGGAKRKRKKLLGGDSPPAKRKPDIPLYEPRVTFADLGGIDSVLDEVSRLMVHMRHPDMYRQLGVPPPRGFLLHGPPGCGKSLLAHAIAGELGLPLLKVAVTELIAGVSGESEERLRDLFQQAVDLQPCVLFLDEIDAIAPNRVTAQREMERRIVSQLLACLDDLGGQGEELAADVLVLGATNRPDALDPALRRAGRFDREVCVGIPDREAREQILNVLCANLRLAPGLNLKTVASQTPGFVGADLSSLTREAALSAISRAVDEFEKGASYQNNVGNSPMERKEPEKAKEEAVPPEKKTSSGAEVIDISDQDTPQPDAGKKVESVEEPSTSTASSAAKTDKPKDTVEDDEICIEAEVTSSEAVEVEVEECGKVDKKEAAGSGDVEVISEVIAQVPHPGQSWLSLQPALSAQLESLYITQHDFEEAVKRVQPSAKREGFATVPDVSWEDVGALQNIREEMKMAILAPIQYPDAFEDFGLTAPTGLLLVGPPGCGKTLLAKAVANEAGINFISVKGPELLNMYVGESEKAVRQCFQRARNSAPCVIFFDELDALCPKRSDGVEGTNASARVVNQMLTEMDGVEERKGVFLLAATNRPDIIDPAVMRPGRLGKILYVGLPGPEDRYDILQALTKGGKRPNLADDVDLHALAQSSSLNNYSGADLAALVHEASLQGLQEWMKSKDGPSVKEKCVAKRHFDAAILRIQPSVSPKDLLHYEKLRLAYSPRPQQTDCPERDTEAYSVMETEELKSTETLSGEKEADADTAPVETAPVNTAPVAEVNGLPESPAKAEG